MEGPPAPAEEAAPPRPALVNAVATGNGRTAVFEEPLDGVTVVPNFVGLALPLMGAVDLLGLHEASVGARGNCRATPRLLAGAVAVARDVWAGRTAPRSRARLRTLHQHIARLAAAMAPHAAAYSLGAV